MPKSEKNACPFFHKNNPFTLVELLVVIMIIAVLASMLLPALKTAKDFARNIECLAHFKTMALSAHMYAGDWNDEIAQTAGSYHIPITWHTGYLGVPPPSPLVDKHGIYISTLQNGTPPWQDSKNPHHKVAKILQCPYGLPQCLDTKTTSSWASTRRLNTTFTPSWDDWNSFFGGNQKNAKLYKFSMVRPSIFLYLEGNLSGSQGTSTGNGNPDYNMTKHHGGATNTASFDGSAATVQLKDIYLNWKRFGLKTNGNHDIRETHDVF